MKLVNFCDDRYLHFQMTKQSTRNFCFLYFALKLETKIPDVQKNEKWENNRKMLLHRICIIDE